MSWAFTSTTNRFCLSATWWEKWSKQKRNRNRKSKCALDEHGRNSPLHAISINFTALCTSPQQLCEQKCALGENETCNYRAMSTMPAPNSIRRKYFRFNETSLKIALERLPILSFAVIETLKVVGHWKPNLQFPRGPKIAEWCLSGHVGSRYRRVRWIWDWTHRLCSSRVPCRSAEM